MLMEENHPPNTTMEEQAMMFHLLQKLLGMNFCGAAVTTNHKNT